MHRFFVDRDTIKGDVVKITGNDFNHIFYSLRLQPGDQIIICTGDGQDCLVELTELLDDCVRGLVVKQYPNSTETIIKISLAQAIPKNKNMELVAQKCTELGLTTLIPLETERTIVKLTGSKEQRRIDRWQKIMREAAKQSQRGIIPVVKKIHRLSDILKISTSFQMILIYSTGETTVVLKDILQNFASSRINHILLMIGPEGGFTEKEVQLITDLKNGFCLSLGPRILRTETAGMVALTTVLYELGELGR